MLRLPFLLILCLVLSACGKPSPVTETKFVISGIAATPIDPDTGSALVTAFNPATQDILRLKMGSSSQNLTLPNGMWYFSVLYWNSSNTEGATLRCGITKAELVGEPVSLSLQVTAAECLSSNFNASQFLDTGAWQPLELHQCSSFGDPNDGCISAAGTAQYVRVIFPSFLRINQSVMTQTVSGGEVGTGCLVTGGSGLINLLSQIPSGSANAPVPFVVQTYSDATCSTPQVRYPFNRGLLSADSASLKVYDYTTPAPDRTRLFILSGASLGVAADPLLVPAESVYPINLQALVSGGVPPYTFTKSGGSSGLSTVGALSPANVNETFTVTVQDSLGATLPFNVQAVRFRTHTIFSNIAVGSWMTTRSGPGLRMPTNPGEYANASAGVPRFFRTPGLDKFLLTERSETNYVLNSSLLNQVSWTQTATNPSTTSDPIYASSSISRLQKASASTSYALQTVSHVTGGDIVVSVHLKAETSTTAAITTVNSAICRGVHIDLVSGTVSQLNAAGCNTVLPVGSFGSTSIGNGWWRVWFRYPASATSSVVKVYPAWGPSASAEDTAGGALSQLLVFNVQLEQASIPTSPIETTTAAVTRVEEYHQNTNGTDIPAISYTAGTLLFDYHPLVPSTEPTNLLSFCDGMTANIEVLRDGAGTPMVRLWEGGSSNTVTGVAAEHPVNNRIVASIGATNLHMAMRNQATVTQAARTRNPVATTDLNIGRDCLGNMNFPVGVRRMGYWNAEFHRLILQQMANAAN